MSDPVCNVITTFDDKYSFIMLKLFIISFVILIQISEGDIFKNAPAADAIVSSSTKFWFFKLTFIASDKIEYRM